jgi:hypothetical protein
VYVTWELHATGEGTIIHLNVDEPWPLAGSTQDLESDHGAEGRPRNGVGLRLEDDIGLYREVWAGARPDAHPAEPGSASPSSCQNSSCVSVRRGRRLPQSHNQGEACSPWPPMGWDRPEESPYKQKEKTMNLISG